MEVNDIFETTTYTKREGNVRWAARISWIEDRGEYFYVGYKAVDRPGCKPAIFMGSFGTIRIYPENHHGPYKYGIHVSQLIIVGNSPPEPIRLLQCRLGRDGREELYIGKYDPIIPR